MPNSIPAPRVWYAYRADATHLSAPDYLGCTLRQTQRLVADHKIAYTRLGLATLFSQEQLDEYLASCVVPPISK